jgi:hypothetical protein
MSRQCISVSGLWGPLFGQSFGPEVLGSPKLPSWAWYKLRKQLYAVGLTRGEALAEGIADYLIGNGLATGRRP